MKVLLSIFLLLICSFAVVADDNALYGNIAPPNASFFRFVNLDPTPVTIKVDDGKEFILDPYHVSRYAFVQPSQVIVSVSGQTHLFDALEASQSTIIIDHHAPEPFKEIKEEIFNNKRKARVKLFNLTNHKALSLETADGKNTVIDAVGQVGFGYRDLNAVSVDLGVFSDLEHLESASRYSFSRGLVVSVFAIQSSEGVVVVNLESEH